MRFDRMCFGFDIAMRIAGKHAAASDPADLSRPQLTSFAQATPHSLSSSSATPQGVEQHSSRGRGRQTSPLVVPDLDRKPPGRRWNHDRPAPEIFMSAGMDPFHVGGVSFKVLAPVFHHSRPLSCCHSPFISSLHHTPVLSLSRPFTCHSRLPVIFPSLQRSRGTDTED